MQDLPQSCPLCGAEKDTAGHRLGGCTHPSIKNQICACHGHAVHAIAQQLRNGDLGKCAMLVDAECNEPYQSFPDAFLPASMQTSHPDTVIPQNVHAKFAGLQTNRRRDPRVVVHLVEIGFTSDLFLHVALAMKHEQHAELCSDLTLTAYAWANV